MYVKYIKGIGIMLAILAGFRNLGNCGSTILAMNLA